MSSQAILTLYEGHYHFGVAALLNSAIAAGFKGRCFVGFRDELPPWIDTLSREMDLEYSVRNTRITFFHDSAKRHFGYHKPFAMRQLFDRYPEIETIYYADPDVIVLAPWKFFENWVKCGIGLVADVNFREISVNHPWRCEWRGLLGKSGRSISESNSPIYPNGGFFALQRGDRGLAEVWEDVTRAYEQEGGDTTTYHMSERWKAVVSDQDLLATALMGWPGVVSVLGPEAMGFTGYYFVLSHAIESPKPWAKSHLLQALRGEKATGAAKEYLRFSNGCIRTSGRFKAFLRLLDFRLSQVVSRFYRRSL